ncbi:PREDICTED: uncharacterized protein LOC108611122 [Drosophila arizonae]|uniref:Uncharacterized protein LOC108611122 n=1 Tax=Drosophila arizonae TaxID=7263 RepID=A0ABM1NVV1_DROAR|nr:PREDICTED: uncharacterized protein LOC108611122 [Drosophila arizonae]
MYSSMKLFACAFIFAQMLGTIHCSSYDNTDNWVISDKTYNFPENAVLGGIDSDGYYSYVGRTDYASSVLPARVRAETGYATFNNDSLGKRAPYYELLVSNATLTYHWVRSYDGFREKHAVSVGTTVQDERVYVCRAKTDGGIFIGTLYLSKRLCFIRDESFPLRQFSKYEVLVRKVTPVQRAAINI